MRQGVLAFAALAQIFAAEHKGFVTYGGLPVPGVSVTATRGDQRLSAITDPKGVYSFAELPDGAWTVQVEMQLFATERREVAISGSAVQMNWDIALSLADRPLPVPKKERSAPAEPDTAATAELAQRAADGFLINGSVNNGAASPFAQLPAFGNNRRGSRPLYNGNLGLIANNALFDARAFSLTGQNTPKPAYSRLQALVSFGGPVKIPGWIRRTGPNFTLNLRRN